MSERVSYVVTRFDEEGAIISTSRGSREVEDMLHFWAWVRVAYPEPRYAVRIETMSSAV